MTPDNPVVHHDYIHSRTKKTVESLFGRIDDRLVLVEARIENYRNSSQSSECGDELVVPRICFRAHGLKAAAAIDVRNCRENAALLLANGINLLHERICSCTNEIFVHCFLETRCRKGTKLLAKFDASVDQLQHVRTPRVSEDAAIAECSRTPLHPALKPADDVSLGDESRRFIEQLALGKFLAG